MGGDHAPSEVVKGALLAARAGDIDLLLVGQTTVVEAELRQLPHQGLPISIVEAPQVVAMDEHPANALRQKPQSSIAVGLHLLKEGKADAFVSAGSTGGVVAFALATLGMMNGIERPAIGVLYPTAKGQAMLMDGGATADCRPAYLLQFAQLGNRYLERVMGIHRPRVGLLNIGEEEGKGNRLAMEAHKLLKESSLNFVGNIEGKDVFKGEVDLVITDGFTGNVALKLSEGLAEFLLVTLRDTLTRNTLRKALAYFLRPALRRAAEGLDYRRAGGALLLGVQGNVVIAHGRSDAAAIRSAVGRAAKAVQERWLEG
jgi:glycerol-3-phosphate acyltransferase PlsX